MPSSGPYQQIILFGDSITEFSASQERGFAFMAALQDTFIRRFDVINRGFSGYNTANALMVLPDFMPTLEQARVTILSVFFGANDACLPGSPGGQFVDIKEYEANLKAMIRHPMVEAHKPRIVIITPPPVNEYALELKDSLEGLSEPRRTAENTQKYAQVCRQIGADVPDLLVVDIWGAMMAKAGWKEGQPLTGSKELPQSRVLQTYLVDGLHLAPAGYRALFKEFMEAIEREWPDLDPLQTSTRFPNWREAARSI